MAYGAGISRLRAAKGREQATERERYERELEAAEEAQREESESSSLWSGVGSVIGGVGGFLLGGPAGAYKGYQVGKTLGTWGQNISSDYDPADYAVSEDVGMFGVSQKYDLQDINRQFIEADKANRQRDITELGTTAMSLLMPSKLPGKEFFGSEKAFNMPRYLGNWGARKFGIGGGAFAEGVTERGLADNPWLAEGADFWN